MEKELRNQVCVLGVYEFDYHSTGSKCAETWVAEAMFVQFLGKQGLTHMVQVGEDLLLTKEPINEELVKHLEDVTSSKDMCNILIAQDYTITNYEPVKELLVDGNYDLVRGLQGTDLDNLSLEDFKANTLS